MTTLATPVDTEVLDTTLMNDDIPVIAAGFISLNLSNNLLKALADMNFVNPSSIQQEAIPQVLSGNDIIAKAPTGSGKTAAFAIPIIEKLDLNPENTSIQAIVLSPTRELAIQVHKEFEKLTKYIDNVSTVSIYGGQNIEKQLGALKRKPQIIVATPGRLMDHLRRGSIKLDLVHTVVLDEADEMLDMGFRDDIHTILEDTPVNRQTILFSATMAKNIMEIAKKFMKQPNVVDVSNDLMNAPDIEQQYFEVAEKNKIELIARLLNLHNMQVALVFCNTKSNVDKVVEMLKTKGYFADAIHGDMNQSQREKVMFGFRKGSVKILVATDVAGRGIDVKNIEAVFNYDLPRDDEDYIHRIGRTGRAGKSGLAFTFVSKRQVQSLRRIERANGIQIHQKDIPSFEEIEIARADNFKTKIRSIIKDEDLSECKSKIESMLNENVDVTDVAAALLKLYLSKTSKKINKDIVFDALTDEISEDCGRRRGRGSRGSRGGFQSRGGRDDRRFEGNRNRSNSDSSRNKKSKPAFSLDDMMTAARTDGENFKKDKFSSDSQRDNKFHSVKSGGDKRRSRFSDNKTSFGSKKVASKQRAK